MTSTQSHHLSVPLGKDAHRWAERFAAEQATPQKGKQVYLNTLAVYAVDSYLKWLTVETALTQGDSWHPGLRAIFDVADLVVPNLGRLECRPVPPDETAFVLPPEVTQDRIGYVAVQFNQQLDSVRLLGFAPVQAESQPPEEIQITDLQSLDALIDTLVKPSLVKPANKPNNTIVNLRQWLEGIFNESWQAPDLVLASSWRGTTRPLRGRTQTNSVSRAKAIYVGRQEVPQPVVLVMKLTPTDTEAVEIRLRLYPGDDSTHLPPNLQLILLDEAGTACIEAQARCADDWMQLEFSCIHEETFSVKVVLGEMSITEQFVV